MSPSAPRVRGKGRASVGQRGAPPVAVRGKRARDATSTKRPRKARKIRLQSGARVRDAALSAVAETRSQFLHNLPSEDESVDPERVHQARVGARKLRLFLRLFRSLLGKKQEKRCTAELRYVFIQLGEVRDLHVFLENYGPQLESQAPALLAGVKGRLDVAELALRAVLMGERFETLCGLLAGVIATLEASPQKQEARGWLARRLDKRRARIKKHAPEILNGEPDALHALRKELKKLRYTAELSRSLYPAEEDGARNYLRALEGLQDVLGDWVDLQVARTILEGVEAKPDVVRTFDEELAQTGESQLRELAHALPRFLGTKPFWKKSR